MPFNGSGVYQRVRNWVADATAGIKIRADYHDTEDDGFAAGLSNCITKDGQTIVTQNIPMNSKRITGLADPVNPQDAATMASITASSASDKVYIDAGDAAATAVANTKVSKTGDVMTGDLTVHRNNTTGYVFLGSNGGARYVGYDGTSYVLGGAHAYSAAGRLWGDGDFNIANYQPVLGFTPVTQGGSNRVMLRWDGGGTRVQIDGNDSFGHIITEIGGTISGSLGIQGNLTVNGDFVCGSHVIGGVGYRCRAGLSGGYSGNYFNVYWVSPFCHAYIDDTDTGLYASDYRIKDNVVDLASTWETVKQLRPVEYNHKDYTPPTEAAQARHAETKQPFSAGSEDKYWGFIAHELQEVLIPTAATGVKDAPNVLQSPNPFVLMAALTKALQEAMARIEALESGGT